METFAAHPVDIFATKGIEYLLVLFFLATFLAFWLYFTTDRKVTVRARGTRLRNLMEWFSIPEGIFFHQGLVQFKVRDHLFILAVKILIRPQLLSTGR